MQHRKLGFVLFALAAAGGCTFNGKSLFKLGGSSSPSSPSSDSGGGGGGGGSEGGGSAAPAVRAPASYAWCKQLKEESSLTDSSAVEEALAPSIHPGRALPGILQGLCYPSDLTRAKRDELEAARQRWMDYLALDEQSWATDIVPWGNLRHEARMDALQRTIRPPSDEDGPVERPADSPVDQWWALRRSGSDAFATADVIQLSEAGRLGLIEVCLGRMTPQDDPNPVSWAVCQLDIVALDRRKLAAELRLLAQRPLEERLPIRYRMSEVLRRLPGHATELNALVARDPVYGKLFEIAKTARTEWPKLAASRTALIELVRAVERKRLFHSDEALQGCDPQLWSRFAGLVAKLPAQRFVNASASDVIMEDLDGYLLAKVLRPCEGSEDPVLSWLERDAAAIPGFRGPRTAALTAISRANLTPKRRGETLTIPGVRAQPPAQPRAQGQTSTDDGRRMIAAVKDRGATVRVSFPATSEKREHCASSRRTNRISKIDDGGNVHYELECLRWQTVTVDTTPAPIDVPKRYAGGLAAKRYVGSEPSIPELVWAKAGDAAPLAVYGILLK